MKRSELHPETGVEGFLSHGHFEAFLLKQSRPLRQMEIASLKCARNDMNKCVFVQTLVFT